MAQGGEHLEPLGNNIYIYVSNEHKFWTDTILLANFAEPKRKDIAADLGTGCGTIPLLWCRDGAASHITAIEIQQNACEMLNKSIALNKLENKINAINSDIKDLTGKVKKATFDLVVCNPPYKPLGTGVISANDSHIIARHEHECTIIDVAKVASELLRFGGRFCLCQRPERLCDIMMAMREADIEPKKLRFVQQRTAKAPKLFLIEGKRGAKPGLITMPTLFIEDEKGDFSDEMKQIYGFYKENR